MAKKTDKEKTNRDYGFVKIYRSLQNHWLWTADTPFDDRSAWIDLIMMANHEDKKLQVGKDIITIHAGQMWTSYVKLARKWNWSKPRVNRYVKMLKKDGMIYTDGTPNGTLLTIVKYEFYASTRNTDVTTGVTADVTASVTTDVTAGVTQTRSIKNIESIKSEENIPAPPRDGGEWQ